MNRKRTVTEARKAPALEWIVAGLGFCAVAFAFGVILMQVLGARPGPPDLAVSAGEVRARASDRIVEVVVRNKGDETAAAVRVRGVAGDQTAELELDYVPAGGEASGSLHFRGPSGPAPALSIIGWREP